MALCKAFPVVLSQTTVVSRWFVMPTALIWLREWPWVSNSVTAPSMHVSTEETISSGSCSCHLIADGQLLHQWQCVGQYSPRVRVDLLELKLMCDDDLSAGVENQKPRAGGALVNGANEGESRGPVCRRHCAGVRQESRIEALGKQLKRSRLEKMADRMEENAGVTGL